MAIGLNTPIVTTTTANTVQITGFVNNREEEKCEIHYMTNLEDGTPYQRGSVIIEGYEDIKALYAEMDAELANGTNFEESSAKILYNKVLAGI